MEERGANVVVWDLPEVDVTDQNQVFEAIMNLKRIDGLINAAAIDSPPDVFPVNEDFLQVLDVNIRGVYICCNLVLQVKTEVNIINVASMYGLVASFWEKNMAYGASKAAVIQMTKQFAVDYPNARVNSVSLGGVEGDQSDEFKREYAKRCPLGRMARIDEYDDVILFMLTTTYMTGSNLVVDGGWTAQ